MQSSSSKSKPFTYPALARSEIDSWSIPTSGLNTRVVNCARAAGIKTIGELREWPDERLMKLRSFGIGSLENIRRFFRWTRVLEAGQPTVGDAHTWLREFLNRRHLFVMEQRYGLIDPLFRPMMRRPTLQEIALMRKHVTRERIRQVEDESLHALRSKLCRAVGDPLIRHWASQMASSGGAVSNTELTEWVGEPTLGGYQPWGLFLLLSDSSGAIVFRYNYFTSVPATVLDRVETRAIRLLEKARDTVPFSEIAAAVGDELKSVPYNREKFLTAVLNHHPRMACTKERRYFLPATFAPVFLARILRQQTKPVHFRELTRLYNERVLPHSHKGSGFILRAINSAAGVRRVSRAYYAVKR